MTVITVVIVEAVSGEAVEEMMMMTSKTMAPTATKVATVAQEEEIRNDNDDFQNNAMTPTATKVVTVVQEEGVAVELKVPTEEGSEGCVLSFVQLMMNGK